MFNKKLIQQITQEVKSELSSSPTMEEVIRKTCEHSISVLNGYISEQETPCPPGVWVLVSVDGVVPAGVLHYKNTAGVWLSWPSNKVKRSDLIRYYKYV